MSNNTSMIIFSIIVFLGVVSVALGWTTVPAGHRGILLEFGKPVGVLTEGFHFKNPVTQGVIIMSIQKQKYEIDADSASKDLQDVRTTIAVNYRVKPIEVTNLYQNIGMDYEERIIAPAVQEGVKSTMASFNAENLISKRPEVKNKIRDFLCERLNPDGIDVSEVSIVNFQFSEEFDKAIEAKQTAQQLALKAENDLIRIETEAKQKIVQAEAEAEAIRIQKGQLTNSPEILQLRFIEKWDGVLPLVLGGDSTMLLPLPVNDVNVTMVSEVND